MSLQYFRMDVQETQFARRVLTFIVRAFLDVRWERKRFTMVHVIEVLITYRRRIIAGVAAFLLLLTLMSVHRNWRVFCDTPMLSLLCTDVAVLSLTLLYVVNLVHSWTLTVCIDSSR